MKTKVKRLSKRTLAVFLGVLMLITSIGVGSLITANAAVNWYDYGGNNHHYIYYDDSTANISAGGTKNVYAMMGYSGGSNVFQMERVSTNTLLYRLDYDNKWTGCAGFGVKGASSAPSGAVTTADRYTTSGDFNGNATVFAYGSKTGTTLTANAWTANKGDEKAYVKNNVTLSTKVDTSGSGTYSTTTTSYATLSLKSHYWNNGSVSSAGAASGFANGSVTYGDAVGAAKIEFSYSGVTNGYAFKGWYDSDGNKLSDAATYTGYQQGHVSNITYYAYFQKQSTTYNNIAVAAKGSTDGSTFNTTLSGTPATISANSYTTGSSALNISAGTVSGYTFYKWVVTAGSGTIGSATTASTTFTPSASNTTVTAQYKKSYTISNNTPTGGSVALSKTSAVAGETYTVTLTPNDGYKVKSLTLNGSAVTVSNNKYTGTASGTADTLAFVATFEPITNLQLYIAGRFRVRPSSGSSSWTTTYASGSDWNATSTNIPFTYLSGTTYKVDTYASLKELSAKPTNNQDPWFFVYDKTNSKAWHPTTQNRELGTTTEYNLTTNTDTYNVRFNSSSDDSPVTIYFDYNTKRLWYSVPDLYDVTVGTVTGGSVTASPARAEAGTEITLTIDPTTGYQLKSITAKDSSNAAITLSGTGNTRTFAMPAKNVTVTPVFEKITWSGLTAVGKYSTTAANDASYSNDFPTGEAPNVTIAATSATQIDGVAVSAPANDPDGYVFAGWYTAKGSFENPANKDTKFKPNAANAVAIAKYKKIFTITSSVDSSGKGAGTVTTDKTSVEAGGSYTITATAASHSVVESVKVNGTAKTATDSQTISSVSADQDVKVKFKSNITIRGNSTIGTDWNSGDQMTSNAAGTEFTKAYENVAGSSSGTSYEFKLHNGTSYSDDSSATVTITGGASTGTLTKAAAGVNWKLTLKQAANVTIKSDGTKITEIKVVPASATKYAVTFKKADNVTITGSYEGTNFTTASADAVVQVYSGDEISFTATADSGKYISTLTTSAGSLTPAFAAGDTYTGKLTNVTSARTVTPTAASKLSVKAVTNKSARGTVTVNKSTAAPGESITITVSPKNGVLKSLTCTYANGAVYTCNLSTKAWTKTTNATNAQAQRSVDGMAAFAFRDKVSKLMTSATAKLFSGADTTYTMTLAENSAATINAVFDAYSAESNYYYYGYDSSGNAISAYNGKQMTEGMISGEKFSYYQVNGRTEDDQRFKVATKATGTRRFYVETPNTTDWNGNDNMRNPYIYWFDNEWGTFEKLTYDNVHGVVDGKKWWYTTNIHEGVGCLIVNMNNTSDGGFKQTADISADDVAYGAVWISSSMSNNKYSIGGRFTENDRPGDAGSGVTYYSWGDSVYATGTDSAAPYSFGTSGFNDHDQNYAKPKGDGYKNGSYYIAVLYPNTTYTINNVTKTTGNKIDVIWLSDLPSDDESVTIYAKDGAIRSETNGVTYANIADTKIYLNNSNVGTKHNGQITNQTYETYKAAKGDTIVIKTQIGATDSGTLTNAADLKAKYYVRGFCVNGEVSELLEWSEDGLYTLTYKVPEDEDLSKIEITPIYYLKDTTANPIVTYRVTGFTDELKAVGAGKPGWGDTLYTYPFYGKLGGQNNAFGAYPGQPMVYYKGQYQIQIPQKSTAWDIYYDDGALSGYSGNTAKANAVAGTNVSGVTMSNGYYDVVHRQIMGYGGNGASADHVQTYDYGDFFKIFNEKKPVDNIVFDFKYRTKKHNFENQPAASITKSTLDTNYGTNGNGFELLTNFHGRNVDLFGTPLSGDAADPSKTTPVYVVSIGGVNGSAGVENIAGYYATEWMVYGSSDGTNYSRITAGGKNSIPPEVLVLNDDDTTSFNTTTYPSADASHNLTNWKDLYTALEAYRGKPVMISYEAADAQIGAGNYATSGGGGATRNDGRWLYSKNGENITSNIKIQYSDDNGANYTDLSTTTPQVSGLSAYFTNDGVEGEMTYATTIDPDKTFDFEAKTTNGNYKFVGWYMEDGTKITTDNASHTERSGSYTFVAKFMQVTTGQLILSHSVDTDATYKGAGTAKIGVVVKNGDEVVRTYDLSTSDITLDDKIIKSDNSDYTIEVTLEATATGNDSLGTTVLANPSGQEAKFYKNPSTTTVDKTNTIVLDSFTVGDLFTNGTTQNVKNIIYHSYFAASTFHYDFEFEYKDRTGATKRYYRQGYLTSAQAANENYVKVVEVENNRHKRYLMPAFLKTIAPHISNFGEKITWPFESSGYEFGVQDHNYTVTNVVIATQTKNDKRNVTFVLPYQHTNGIATLNGNVGIAATTTNFELTGNNAVTFASIPELLNGDENGIFTEEGKKNWIAAPAVIADNGTQKFFQYWSIKTTSDKKEVARCYFNGFNYTALDNYEITAIYGNNKTDISQSGIYTGATYLESSRNQWNDNQDRAANAKNNNVYYAADLIYNDFILNFNYKGVELRVNSADSDRVSEIGVVIERVKKLDIKQDGSFDTDMSKYSSSTEKLDTIKDVINGTVSTSNTYIKNTIDKGDLDNKNRYHLYDAFYNGTGWSVENQDSATKYPYKNQVYRIYSYMKYTNDQGDADICLAAVPSYFTMNNEATKDYTEPKTN